MIIVSIPIKIKLENLIRNLDHRIERIARQVLAAASHRPYLLAGTARFG
jgi:hypothetical protein